MDSLQSSRNRRLSPKASKRFVVGILGGMLVLAFFSALGIKIAAEDASFQEEVQEMRGRNDPSNMIPVDSNTSAQPVFSDSTSQN